MKRRFTFSLLGSACLALTLTAAPRSAGDALKVAKSFYEGKSLLRSVSDSDFHLVYTGEGSALRSTSGDPYYYIYNVGTDGGFVMVSGDDRVAPVMGYSLSGSFRPENMPSNLKGWFEDYERQIDYARTLPERPYPEEVSPLRSDAGFPERVEPLIKTKWYQEAPYNELCPLDGDRRSLTGCVATATAQIMNYHQWPEKAVGEGQYRMGIENVDETVFPVDLNGYTFDWTNMADTYDSTSTTAQNKAVAELMYAAGVAGNMFYSSVASGTMDEYMAVGLIENLGYDKNLVSRHRDYYTSEEWIALLKSDLAEKLPVLYGANATEGGHAFICDGYDENGLFHINWGWSGNGDGYYELDVLNPYTRLYGGFSFNQDMITGIQKPTEESVPFLSLNLYSASVDKETIRQGDTLRYTGKIVFEASSAKELECAIGVFTKEGLVEVYDESEFTLRPYYDMLSFEIPSLRLDPGIYMLRTLYRFPGEKEWQTVKYSLMKDHDIHLLAKDSVIETIPYVNEYVGVQPIQADKPLVSGGGNVLRVTIRNTSVYERNANISFGVYSLSTGDFENLSIEGVYLLPGEEKEIYAQTKVNLPPGRYLLSAYATNVPNGREYYFIEGTDTLVTVEGSATGIESVVPDEGLFVRKEAGGLSVSSVSPIREAYLFDVVGNLCSTGVMSETGVFLSTAGLPKGIYLVRVRTAQGWMGKKVIVR